MNNPDDFAGLKDLFEQTGLTSRELARLFKTTQTTVLAWAGNIHNEKPGAPPRQALLRAYALKVIAMLRKIVASGDLPLKSDVPQKDRAALIAAVWNKHLRNK